MKVGDLVKEWLGQDNQVGIVVAIFSWETIDDYIEVFWLNSKDKERLPTWQVQLMEVKE
jgi:predicted FMN-binding regulatory protein PaiB